MRLTKARRPSFLSCHEHTTTTAHRKERGKAGLEKSKCDVYEAVQNGKWVEWESMCTYYSDGRPMAPEKSVGSAESWWSEDALGVEKEEEAGEGTVET